MKINKGIKKYFLVIFLLAQFIPLISNAETSPTCTLYISPAVIHQGEQANWYLVVTGPVDKVEYNVHGVMEYWGNSTYDIVSFPKDSLNYKDRNGYDTGPTKISPPSIGDGYENIFVYGPGGSSSCTASITVLPKNTNNIAVSNAGINNTSTKSVNNDNQNQQTSGSAVDDFIWFAVILFLLPKGIKKFNEWKEDIKSKVNNAKQEKSQKEEEEQTHKQQQSSYQKTYTHESNNNQSDDIKKIYHTLLKKYHPDFARSDEDKKFRTDLTAKIIKAYENRDINTLRMFL